MNNLIALPVGTVISYYGTVAPDGYFVCDGASFDDAAFPKLRAVLGSDTLPDLRGYFVRGYDTRNDVDPDGAERELASAQGDAIRNIKGFLYNAGWYSPNTAVVDPGNSVGTGFLFSWDKTTQAYVKVPYTNETSTGHSYHKINFDASQVVPTAAENRPKNKTLLYCIKHDEPETPSVPEKASIDETVVGTDDAKYVTPAGVAAAIAAQPAPQPIIPDLRVGVETLWPMRYQGKQVYAQLVECGSFPNDSTKSIPLNIPNIDWMQISWDYSRVSGPETDPMFRGPMYHFGSATARILALRDRLDMRTSTTYSHHSATVCILYTKTTDQPVNP